MNLRLLAATSILAGCAAVPPAAEPQRPAVELAGRTPGPAQRCVSINQSESLRVSETDRRMLIYGSGRTIWANPLPEHLFIKTKIDLETGQYTSGGVENG